MIDMSNKVALVTGGASGIGQTISLTLANAGARLVIADLNEEPREGGPTTVQLIRDSGGEADFVRMDVTDSGDVSHHINALFEDGAGVDILVNNAGVLAPGSITETEDEAWHRQMSVNVDGTFFCTREVIRNLVARSKGGKVVNISSISGFRGNPGFVAYCTAKGAIVNLTRQVALDYAPVGINVNAVAPGFVETEMTALYDQETKDRLTSQTPRGRWATAQDVANAVLFLSSSMADHICGENLLVDGGWTIGTPLPA